MVRGALVSATHLNLNIKSKFDARQKLAFRWSEERRAGATLATLGYTGLHCTEDRGMRGPGHQWRLLLTIHDRDSSNGSQ